jgi:hypothetical protein
MPLLTAMAFTNEEVEMRNEELYTGEAVVGAVLSVV